MVFDRVKSFVIYVPSLRHIPNGTEIQIGLVKMKSLGKKEQINILQIL